MQRPRASLCRLALHSNVSCVAACDRPADGEFRMRTWDPGQRFRAGLLLLVGAAVLMYLPVAAGYVPLPADIVLFFPPWEGVAKGCCAGMQHAEMGDLVTQFYSWRTVLNSTASLGRAPLWNFHYLMGAPYQANPLSALFFPLNWLYSIFPGPLAWSLSFILRTALLE